MFKRRSHYESDTALKEDNYRSTYREPETPPRIFEGTTSPYRTPAQAYPHHREEAQDVLNQEVSDEESWKSAGLNGERLNLEEPETTIGEGVRIKGELAFERFIRIDGEFEGEIVSNGKITVGPKGVVRSNLALKEAIIEGRVEGNIVVEERLELRGDAKVYGDIQARLLAIDEGVTIIGNLTVKPIEQEP